MDMKRHHVFEFPELSFTWTDLVNPTEKDLKSIAKQHGLDKSSVLDCLDPKHLPKSEPFKAYSFLILRYFDENGPPVADTVQELTRKIAIFRGPNFLISIHRQDSLFLTELRKKWSTPTKDPETQVVLPWNPETPEQVFFDVLYGASASYEAPLARANDQLEDIEMAIFEAAGASPFEMEKGYYLKRQASVFKRIVRASQETIYKFQNQNPLNLTSTHFVELKDLLDKLYFYADELNDNVAGLLNLHLSLSSHKTNEASHRTNEVVRILTVVSLFFLPLNFIAGIYGMNFEHMPELKWEHGYYGVLLFMVLVAVGLYLWFRHRGWLRSESSPSEY